MNRRFTVSGSQELENMISYQMDIISNEVQKIFGKNHLAALVLGGGYGKGEGGVCATPEGERTFNDYDFFVITNNISLKLKKRYHEKLKELHKTLTEKFGIDVDFAFPVNRSSIKKLPFTQMWGELKPAHIIVYGDKNILETYPYSDLSVIPLSEAKKLLLNRGYGLVLARNRIENLIMKGISIPDHSEVDFIARNIFKAAIGIGDSLMMKAGLFHHSYVEREKIFKNIESVDKEMKKLYSDAIKFKLAPDLDIETENLKEYLNITIRFFRPVYGSIISGKGSADNCVFKNIALNFREFGLPSNLKWVFKYPRERLLFSLPYFLIDDSGFDQFEVCEALNINKKCHKIDMFRQFTIIWERFN